MQSSLSDLKNNFTEKLSTLIDESSLKELENEYLGKK